MALGTLSLAVSATWHAVRGTPKRARGDLADLGVQALPHLGATVRDEDACRPCRGGRARRPGS